MGNTWVVTGLHRKYAELKGRISYNVMLCGPYKKRGAQVLRLLVWG
jgi:hypothetical protein